MRKSLLILGLAAFFLSTGASATAVDLYLHCTVVPPGGGLQCEDYTPGDQGEGQGQTCTSSSLFVSDMANQDDATAQFGHPGQRVEAGNNPPSWATAISGWGAIGRSTANSHDTNTSVEVRNFRVYIRYGAGSWETVSSTTGIGWMYCTNSFSSCDQSHESGPNGITQTIPHGKVFHFWPAEQNEQPIDTNNITGIYAAFEARLVKTNPNGTDDRNIAKYLGISGADYYGDGICCYQQSPAEQGEIGGGKLKKLSNDWQWFTFTTVPVSNIPSANIPTECTN
jgi:hypothetical protein